MKTKPRENPDGNGPDPTAAFVSQIRYNADRFEHYARLGLFVRLECDKIAANLRAEADKIENQGKP